MGGAKRLEDDARLRAWLAIKYGSPSAAYAEVAGDMRGLVEAQLAGYPSPIPADDPSHPLHGHVATKLVKQEISLLTDLAKKL